MELNALIKEQYQVIERIGRGGMADVWSARDQRLRRMVAVKTIAGGLAAEFDPVRLFEQEAQTIARMEHPHILPIYDFGEYDNSLYIVMRYITGGSLEDLLARGALEPTEVLRMGDAVAQALDYAHKNNVIHLDLKPANILLDSARVPYLADFGLATVLDRDGRARNPGSGTLLYMAPEQLTSDLIDHRADIYSFCVMLFHMLTGEIPYEGSDPMALQQIQHGHELPELAAISEIIPPDVTTVLRRGTSQNPSNRQQTHGEIIDELRRIFQDEAAETSSLLEFEVYNVPLVDDSALGLTEAKDIYDKARHLWQGGNGRFVLGVSHFMLMADFYREAKQHKLRIDQWGYQMLLRGALEYDYDVAYWWKQMGSNADRRWVCLHALRSGNAPARIRALERLEHLPDAEGDVRIPKLVSQALAVETDDKAKVAALQVLATRAESVERYELTVDSEKAKNAPELSGLSATLSAMGLTFSLSTGWRSVVFSEEIDTQVAEAAFDESPEVAAFAARAVGKMRSLTSVEYIAEAQKAERPGALDALALIRDETPSLPPSVSRQARTYAWITNTVRRLTEKPLDTIMRFALVLLAGWLAMGNQVYGTYRSQALFSSQRWANTIAVGVVFGLFIAITYIVSAELNRRLRGFWAWWGRLVVFGILGYLLAFLSYTGFTWLFYQYTPAGDLMRFAGFGLATGLVLSTLLELRSWQAILFTAFVAFVPIFYAHNGYYHARETNIAMIALIGLYIGAFAGWRASQLVPPEFDMKSRTSLIIGSLVGVGAGILWAGYVWLDYTHVLTSFIEGNPFSWDYVLEVMALSMVVAAIFTYFLNTSSKLVFVISASVLFVGIYALVSWHFYTYAFNVPVPSGRPMVITYYSGVPLLPPADQPVFHFDDLNHLYQITLPMIIVIALGANMLALLNGWMGWIGKPRAVKERGGWLASMLLYTLLLTGVASVLALFSLKVDSAWALGWSAWAFITFIFALATYRWAKWGANGLMLSGVLFLLGGFLFDYVNMNHVVAQGMWPSLLQMHEITLLGTTITVSSLYIWGAWAGLIGLFTWGAMNGALWSGIGLAALLAGWYLVAILSNIQGSMTIFALNNVALIFFALRGKYVQMENDRFRMPQFSLIPIEETDAMEHDTEPPSAPPTVANIQPPTKVIADMHTAVGVRDEFAAKAPTQAIADADDMHTAVSAKDDYAAQHTTQPIVPDFDGATVMGVRDEYAAKRETQLAHDNTDDDPDTNPPVDDSDAQTAQPPTVKLDMTNLRSQTSDDDDGATKPSPKISLNTGKVGSKNTINLGDIGETDTDEGATKPAPKISLNTGRVRSKNTVNLGDIEESTGDDDSATKPTPKITLNTGKVRSKHTINLGDMQSSDDDDDDKDDESSEDDE